MKKNQKMSKGITLISLVVTVIVLLILAGVSISMLSGDNGLLKKAGQARDDTIIGEEREQVELAYISAAVKKLGDDVTYQDLQDELDTSVGTNKTKVTKNANNTLNVLFKDTEHNYNVNDGKVAKVEDGSSDDSEDTSTDLAKLQEYFSKGPSEFWNMSTNTYQDVENVDVDSSKIHDIYQGDFLITEYKNKFYKVDYSTFEVSTVDIDIETFGVQEVGGKNFLITPSTSDHLIHGNYDGPGTYYDEDNNEFTGYCAHDNDGYNRYYNTSGAIVPVEEIREC